MPRLPFDDDPRYDIGAVQERYRKYIRDYGGKYEQFKGVFVDANPYDLRSEYVNIVGPQHGWRKHSIDLAPLAALVHVKKLEIGLCKMSGYLSLGLMPKLTTLYFNSTRGRLPELPPNLEHLSIWDCEAGRADFASLPSSLISADLAITDVTTLRAFENLPNLRSLNLASTPVDTLLNKRSALGVFGDLLGGRFRQADPSCRSVVAKLKNRGVAITFHEPSGI